MPVADRFVLLFRLEGQEPLEQPLASGECIIGRAPDCDLVLNHEEVSRRHHGRSADRTRLFQKLKDWL